MKTLMLIAAACAALLVAGCGDDDDSSAESGQSASAPAETSGDASNRGKPEVTVPSGAPPKQLEENDLIEGTGPEAKSGDKVTVQYVGVGYDSGEEFDASWNRNEPFSFTLGASEVIAGWDQGIEGMKVGGQRELVIPPELAYGATGSPPVIGPNETLIFVVDLLEVG
ncbi:MAG: FKBP-type peptidyl-prolyl cis-trans isomerase [Solirubrobacterales bacterium]